MKNLIKAKSILLHTAFCFTVLQTAPAATYDWDGGGGNTDWNNSANWNPDGIPAGGGDIANIGSGYTVTHNHSAYLSGSLTINLDGELNSSGVLRLSGNTINVGSTGLISGGFKDLNNGTLNFDNGAQFTASNWEHKGNNVFAFNLGSAGFTPLTPGQLNANGAVSTTYSANMADYTAGTGIITLVDFGSDATGLDNATFTGGGQYTLSVVNTGSNKARLYWDDAANAVKLNVNPTTTWDGGGADANWTTGANWSGDADNTAPVSGIDNVAFDTAVSSAQALLNTPFVISNGRIMDATGTGGYLIRLASDLTVESGGTLDFSTGGNHVIAESGSTSARLTVEAGANVNLWRLFSGDGWTFDFTSGLNGVTTVEIAEGFWIRGGADLELDVSLRNGAFTETLFNYGYITDDGTFENVTISDIDLGTLTLSTFDPAGDPGQLTLGTYWIDYGDGSDDSITLLFKNAVPEPSTLALLGAGLATLVAARRRRNKA